jgi:hypothetical protein
MAGKRSSIEDQPTIDSKIIVKRWQAASGGRQSPPTLCNKHISASALVPLELQPCMLCILKAVVAAKHYEPLENASK